MAKRAIYVASEAEGEFIFPIEIEFQWYSGFSKSQKQKSILSLHESFHKQYPKYKVLEISTASMEEVGYRLSAFNLQIPSINSEVVYTLEAIFQASKKFVKGGPYKDIKLKSSVEAKKDERLRNSGDLVAFIHKGEAWPLEPKTLFYDWLYINVVHNDEYLSKEIIKYDAFTDIEFNPKKSINCQAKSAALYVSLYRRGILEEIISNKGKYMEYMTTHIETKDEKAT